MNELKIDAKVKNIKDMKSRGYRETKKDGTKSTLKEMTEIKAMDYEGAFEVIIRAPKGHLEGFNPKDLIQVKVTNPQTTLNEINKEESASEVAHRVMVKAKKKK
jgi:hypothetical protein